MFRRYRIWRAEQALAEARHNFSLFGQESGTAQREIIENIVLAKRNQDRDWGSAPRDVEVQRHLYELLLHQQYMGYLAETIRQKSNELYGLKNKISGLVLFSDPESKKQWAYGEDLGSSPSNSAQLIIYQEFLVNTIPGLERIEAEMFERRVS